MSQDRFAEMIEAGIRKEDSSCILEGLRLLFEHRKRGSVVGGDEWQSIQSRILTAVTQSLEWSPAHLQIGELACGWLSLVVGEQFLANSR